jgi:hypothetical protein
MASGGRVCVAVINNRTAKYIQNAPPQTLLIAR